MRRRIRHLDNCMADERIISEMAALWEQHAGLGVPEIGDRDMACAILPILDYEAQLIAISGLLERNEAANQGVETKMRE